MPGTTSAALGLALLAAVSSTLDAAEPPPPTSSGCTPFLSVDVPEGNYRVTMTLGNDLAESVTTVKAESRRLMLEKVRVAAGRRETRRFTVNVRSSEIATGGAVQLKERERGALHWDGKLSLAVCGVHPSVAGLEIEKVEDAVTIYLAGDSTVTDQARAPWAAWGQTLPRFFGPGVAIANHAESGETLLAFRHEGRLAKILSTIRAGDYLFLQFGHNDQKPGATHLDAFTTFKEQLRLYIAEARRKGAIPVLVTSMPRRKFDDAGRIVNTLGDYPEAVRQTAAEEAVALIDLNAAATAVFEALGPEASKRAFVHYPAGQFPGQPDALSDDSHFSTYGAYQLARAVAAGIAASNLGLAKDLIDTTPFDPAQAATAAQGWDLPE